MRKFWKYLKELSVVIIGVTITLMATNWIGNRQEKKNLQLYLDAVKLELESNLEMLKKFDAYYERTYEYGRYLRSNDPSKLEKDTLTAYSDVLEYTFYYNYKSSAYDMLKSSGAMRLLNSRDLLLNVWDSYAFLAQVKQENDEYMKMKADMVSAGLRRAFATRNQDGVFYVDIRKPEQQDLYIFFISHNKIVDFKGCIEQISQTLAKF